MSRGSYLLTGVLVLACCCCCVSREDDAPRPPQRGYQAAIEIAYVPATEAARISANNYVSGLQAALWRELPSLPVRLGSAVKDWCDERECVLDVDYFFAVDSDPLPHIDTVLRRDSTNIVEGAGRTPCPERLYELGRPVGTTNVYGEQSSGVRRWMARVSWADTADTICAPLLRPAPDVRNAEIYVVRDHDVDVPALLAGVRGKHRFIVQVGVGGSYHTGGNR